MFFISYSTTTSTIPTPWKSSHTLSYINTDLIHSMPMITFCTLFFLISIILPYISSTSNFFIHYETKIHLVFILLSTICLLTFLVFYLYNTNTFFDTNKYNEFINDYISFQENNRQNLTLYSDIKLTGYNNVKWSIFNSEESFSQIQLIDDKLQSIPIILNLVNNNTAIKYVNLENFVSSLIDINYESNLMNLCNLLINSMKNTNNIYSTKSNTEFQQILGSVDNSYTEVIANIDGCKSNLNKILKYDSYLNKQPYSNPRGVFSNIFIPTISYINTPNSSYTLKIDQNSYMYFDNTKPSLYINNNAILTPLNKITNNLTSNAINFGNNTISIPLNAKEYVKIFTDSTVVGATNQDFIIIQGAGIDPADDTFLYPTLIIIPTNSGIYSIMCQYSLNVIKNVILLTPFNQVYKFISKLSTGDLSAEFSVNPINNIYETNTLYNYVKNIQLTTNIDLQFQDQFQFFTRTTNNLQVLSFPINCSSYLQNYSLYSHFEITQYPDQYNIYLYYGNSSFNDASKIKNNYLKLICSNSTNKLNIDCYKNNQISGQADVFLQNFSVNYH